MDDPKLREQLEQLQAEIRQSRSVDEEGKALLRDLDADIHDLLARSAGEAVEVQPSTVDRLQDSLTYFEVSHPSLTALIAKLLETLSNAGI
jgi:DNA-binding GntR family transcriptional regulator